MLIDLPSNLLLLSCSSVPFKVVSFNFFILSMHHLLASFSAYVKHYNINTNTHPLHHLHKILFKYLTYAVKQVNILYTSYDRVAQWLSGKALDLRSLGRGFDSHRRQLRSNLGQVVHTCLRHQAV